MEIIRNYIEREGLSLKDKKRKNVYRRFYLYAYLRETCGMTLEQIGKEFDRDHSTIVHGLKKYEDWKEEKYFNEIIQECRDEFEMGVVNIQNIAMSYMYEILGSQNKLIKNNV